jgi:hypothetical protein
MTSGEELARLILLIRLWQQKSVNLKGATTRQTKNNINRWLTEFETTFSDGTLRTSEAYMVEGARQVNNVVAEQGGETRTDLSDQVFIAAYANRTQQMRGKVLTQARGMRNFLALEWRDKQTVDNFFKKWDAFQIEANALGLTLREQVEGFLKLDKDARTLTYLVDSAGRRWQPGNYAAMYARTRGRELEDIVRMDETRELGINVVQISNANTTTPICLKYEGKFFWVDVPVEGLEQLPIRPPFHPNCVHRIFPMSKENPTKFRKTNANKNKKFRNASKSFTPSQKKNITTQTDWNLANRIQV